MINSITSSDNLLLFLKSSLNVYTYFLVGISPVNNNHMNPSGNASSPSPLGPSLALGNNSVAS